MNREVAELWSDAIGAPGTVIRYGHWGDAGRVKLYCVDSYDARTWSDASVSIEERAMRHGEYESWILDQVAPWIARDCGGGAEVATLGRSLGAWRAQIAHHLPRFC